MRKEEQSLTLAIFFFKLIYFYYGQLDNSGSLKGTCFSLYKHSNLLSSSLLLLYHKHDFLQGKKYYSAELKKKKKKRKENPVMVDSDELPSST